MAIDAAEKESILVSTQERFRVESLRKGYVLPIFRGKCMTENNICPKCLNVSLSNDCQERNSSDKLNPVGPRIFLCPQCHKNPPIQQQLRDYLDRWSHMVNEQAGNLMLEAAVELEKRDA